MPTLLEINEEFLSFKAALDAAGDELTPEVETALDSWFADLRDRMNAKMDAIGGLIRNYELRAAARRAEMERLAIRVRVDEANARRLKQRLLEFLDANEIQRYETERYLFSACNNGGKTPVETPALAEELPPQFRKVEWKPDLDAIRTVLEHGGHVPGCRLKERGRHLKLS